MHYDPKKLIPGKFGYRCRHCSNIAFAFVGDVKPAAGTYLEDYEASQQGRHATVRRSKQICQHCSAAVTASGGLVNMNCVVDIDDYVSVYQQRLDRSNSRHGSSRSVRIVTVDREYLGCGRPSSEQVDPPEPVAPPSGDPVADAM